MRMPRFPRLVAAVALLLGAPLARATTVVQPTFAELVSTADYVVRAEVQSVASSWRDNPAQPGQRYIGSTITLTVREIIKGAPPQPLVLDTVGGKVGNDELRVDGTPRLASGDECILFVRGNGHTFFPLVGLMHGYFPVLRDRSGSAQVLQHDGQPLTSVAQLEPGAVRGSVKAQRGMTPEAFRDRILQQQRTTSTREHAN